MLSGSRLQAIICTTKPRMAEDFYCHVLQLPLRGRSHGALILDVGGTDLRISPVPSLMASEHTVLGFSVGNVDAVVADLKARGVELVRFPGFHHQENGALVTPGGDKVAWFKDPDGNRLAIVQYEHVQPGADA